MAFQNVGGRAATHADGRRRRRRRPRTRGGRAESAWTRAACARAPPRAAACSSVLGRPVLGPARARAAFLLHFLRRSSGASATASSRSTSGPSRAAPAAGRRARRRQQDTRGRRARRAGEAGDASRALAGGRSTSSSASDAIRGYLACVREFFFFLRWRRRRVFFLGLSVNSDKNPVVGPR